MTEKSIAVSERTHASLFLLQAKLMVSDKKQYSMNAIINKLMVRYDSFTPDEAVLADFKLENIET